MSHIVIYLDNKALEPKPSADLQKTLNKSAKRLEQAIGKDEPVVELELFDKKYEEHCKMLKRLVKVLQKHKLSARIYELPEGSTMDTCDFVDECKITTKVLSNILA